MSKIIRKIERFIIYTLIVLMSGILVLATIELGHHFIISIIESKYLIIDLDVLMELFGVMLLVLIGIELLNTIKIYLRNNIVHVEVVVLIAIIAIARKVIILKIEELSGELILGIAALIISLAAAYFLIKKAGLLTYDCNEEEAKKDNSDQENDILTKV